MAGERAEELGGIAPPLAVDAKWGRRAKLQTWELTNCGKARESSAIGGYGLGFGNENGNANRQGARCVGVLESVRCFANFRPNMQKYLRTRMYLSLLFRHTKPNAAASSWIQKYLDRAL